MFGLSTMMNAGWQIVQSTLSAVGGMLFSSSPEGLAIHKPMGLNKVVVTKGYWIDWQREALSKLRESKDIQSATIQSQLNTLLDQLGARLGSPAVMLVGLQQTKEAITDKKTLGIVNDAIASIQASMVKDPHMAYANLVADIQMLLKETSMAFFNSDEGRTWLLAYRPFFSDEAFERALLKIENYANAQIGVMYNELKIQGNARCEMATAIERAQLQIDEFVAWTEALRLLPRKRVSLAVQEKLRDWAAAKVESARAVSALARVSSGHRIFSSALRLLKLPVALLSHYPKLSSGLLLVSQLGLSLADEHPEQGADIEACPAFDSFESTMLKNEDIHIGYRDFSVEDITGAYLEQLQEKDGLWLTGEKARSPSEDIGRDLSIGPEGEIVVVGETRGYGAGRGDVLLMRLSAEGKLEWVRTLGGTNGDSGNAVAVDQAGQIVLTGSTWSYGEGNRDLLLAKFSPKGELRWALTTGGSGYDSGNCVAIGSEGQIVLAGATDGYGERSSGSMLLAQFSPEGAPEWVQTLSGAKDDAGNAVAIGPTGQIVVVGGTWSYGMGMSDLLLAVYDQKGNLRWARTLGGLSYEQGYGVAIDALGKVVLLGDTSDLSSPVLAKYTPNGELIWARACDLGEGFFGHGAGVTIDLNGDIIFVGHAVSFDSTDALLVQCNDGGVEKSAMKLGGQLNEVVMASSVSTGPENQKVMVGSAGKLGLLLAQLDSEGTLPSLAGLSASEVKISCMDAPLTSKSIPLATAECTTNRIVEVHAEGKPLQQDEFGPSV